MRVEMEKYHPVGRMFADRYCRTDDRMDFRQRRWSKPRRNNQGSAPLQGAHERHRSGALYDQLSRVRPIAIETAAWLGRRRQADVALQAVAVAAMPAQPSRLHRRRLRRAVHDGDLGHAAEGARFVGEFGDAEAIARSPAIRSLTPIWPT